MKKALPVILAIAAIFAFSSCDKDSKGSKDGFNICGHWKQNGIEAGGEQFPMEYCYFDITSDKIDVLAKDETLTKSFSYTRKDNKVTLSEPFAGKYTSFTIDYVSYSESKHLGQMTWNCGGGQIYFFIIWDKQ